MRLQPAAETGARARAACSERSPLAADIAPPARAPRSGDNLDCHKTITAPPGATISLTFSHMSLESGAPCAGAHGGVGCDAVTLYDGPDITSPVIGTFSGTDLPPAQVTTGNTMTVRFETDTGNYGFEAAGVDSDPGFYADWHFIDHLTTQGDGICPAPAVYTDPHGSIHDDERSSVNCQIQARQCGSMGGGDAGYADNTHCYTTIHAPTDQQVRLTFMQMNLELQGCNRGQPNGGCPEGGCDYVEVFDGQESSDPLIGKYSGYLTGAELPSIVSTGEWLRIEFHTDTRNCGISAAEDPGWFADWDFVESGQNICEPDAAVLHDEFGVLHDDDISTANSFEEGGAGYGDNLDCGVRIRGSKQSTINLHVVQMSLEGDGYGICDPAHPQYIGHSCDENGGDFLYIYDGRDENAPLLAQLNGSPTDAVLEQDTFTSTGRDMFVRFTTDAGNYGLTGTTTSPGFYAEWSIIDDGQECDAHFTQTPSMAIRGHNNEKLDGVTVEQCEDACCARQWCESFDYIAFRPDLPQPGEVTAPGQCNLADVDVSTNMAASGASPWNTLYEKPNNEYAASSAPAGLGANGCAQMLQTTSRDLNNLCCPHGGCQRNMPDSCSEDCAGRWMPFVRQCSEWMKEQSTPFDELTEMCEREQYGRYRAGSNHGRCSDGDIATYTSEFAPACCGENMEYCPTLQPGNPTGDIVEPTMNGAPYCAPGCAAYLEEMYVECQPRFESMTNDQGLNYNQIIEPFLGVCQGLAPAGPGGGHRRAQDDEAESINM